jgi:large subunit ribosomal protein L25
MIRMFSLAIEKRDMKNSADVIRKSGKMPAVFYGPKEVSTPVVVSMIEFKKVWKEAGESSVIILKDSKGNEHEVLIHDTDVHPLSGEPRHADFYVIEKGKKVKVAIPLVFDGVSPAVKDKGGILVKVRRDIDIEAAPRDLPRDIRVDISKLVEFADVIHVKDLHIPKGVEVKISPDEIVASVYEAKEEVVEAPTTIDMSAIEVEAKGKETKESLDSATSTTPGATPGKGKEGEAKKI